MTKAFTFGKFLPFHKGHEALIRFALDHCDQLSVLVCCSDRELIPGETRQRWIEETFAGHPQLEVQCFQYDESELPNTSVSSREVSKIWSEVFTGLFPDCNLVITSEAYGNYVANYMGTRHLAFDPPRQRVPVSASLIINDLFTYWKYLPDPVKPDFALKIALLGTESTGKSTLTARLAQHYRGSAVMEAGRDLIPDSRDFAFEDLYRVAAEHARRIDEAARGDSPLVFMDTDINITLSYAQFVFGKQLDVPEKIYRSNQAHLYLYLNCDAPFTQDGTRLNEAERNRLDESHRQVLAQRNIPFVEVGGDWEQRFETAKTLVDQVIAANSARTLTV